MKAIKAFLIRMVQNQLFIPLAALLFLVLFNIVVDPSFFRISLEPSSEGYPVLSGYLITIIDNASELAILAIGMTLVTAASGGQDISVGSTIAIAGSVVLRVLCGTDSRPETLKAPIIVAFLVCVIVSALFGQDAHTIVGMVLLCLGIQRGRITVCTIFVVQRFGVIKSQIF